MDRIYYDYKNVPDMLYQLLKYEAVLANKAPVSGQRATDTLKSENMMNSTKARLNELSTAQSITTSYTEKFVKIVLAGKDFVASAARSKPHAALAWAGVSILLPVSLSPYDIPHPGRKHFEKQQLYFGSNWRELVNGHHTSTVL